MQTTRLISPIEEILAPRGTTALTLVSDADAQAFQDMRPRLFGIAYRVLGDATEAHDVVQDTWIRWQTTDRSEVRDSGAFLVTAATRLAINVIQSARARRETSVGPELVERVERAGAAADPSVDAERREAMEHAVQMLLERLSPAERGAFVLREAFDYPHRRIAEVLGLSEANARQLVTRARRSIAGEARRTVGAAEHERFLDAITAAAQRGELATLEALLAADLAVPVAA